MLRDFSRITSGQRKWGYRTISGVNAIPGKDRIVQYELSGWRVIDQKGRYQVGELVIYCEPDCWMPVELAPFLVKGEPEEYEGVKGARLRTIKMGSVISQGLILPADTNPALLEKILNWEPPEREFKGAEMDKRPFPWFIPKTDVERVQNIDLALLDPTDTYEVTEKLEGASITVYQTGGVSGLCSRNWEINPKQKSWYQEVYDKYKLFDRLFEYGRPMAIQGEVIGPGIEGNIYGLDEVDVYWYALFDLDLGEYIEPADAREFFIDMGLKYVPVIEYEYPGRHILAGSYVNSLVSRLKPDILGEGVVYKNNHSLHRLSPYIRTFKAISPDYLAQQDKRRR